MSTYSNFLAALQYYYDEGYTYIELGDGDELWQNPHYLEIIETYSDCYSQMARFHSYLTLTYMNRCYVEMNSMVIKSFLFMGIRVI